MWRIYRSHCQWPVQWYRLKGGYLVRFFGLTIIGENLK
jgi:hypothetical protein